MAPAISIGSVLLIARQSRKAPSSSQISVIASFLAVASSTPAATARSLAASTQLSNTSAVAFRSGSLVLATSSATVAIGHASS